MRPLPGSKGLAALIVVALGAAFVWAGGGAPAAAQSGGSYPLVGHAIAGGGVTRATGGPYALGGTIGQPDAGVQSSAPSALAGGFWSPAAIQTPTVIPRVRLAHLRY